MRPKASAIKFLAPSYNPSLTLGTYYLQFIFLNSNNEVLASLLIMEFVRFSFRKDLVLPMRAEATVSSSEEILQSLASQKPEDITPPSQTTTPKTKRNKPVVIYRGQVVQDTSPIETPEHIPAPEVKSKNGIR